MTSASAAGPSEPLLDRLQAAVAVGGPREGATTLLDEVEEALSREAEVVKLGDGDVQGTLFDEPFVLLDFLLPLVSALPSDHTMTDRARACMNLVGTLSSPKEVVMGVRQKLAELVSAECAANEDDDSSEGERDSGDVRNSAVQLACLIGLYERALPRIKTKQFRPFTEPACDAILAALSHLVAEGAFQPYDPLDTETLATDNLAFVVFRQVVFLVTSMERPMALIQMGPFATNPLRALLYETVGRLHSLFLPVDIAAELAGEVYPQVRDRFTRTEDPEVRDTWKLAVFAADFLHDDAPTLLYHANDPEAPLVHRLGQFVVALHILSVKKPRSIMDSQMPGSFSSPFEPSLPFLREVIQQPELRLGEDELLFWLWWVVASHLRKFPWDTMPLEKAYSILEVLTPLAAQSPSPANRFVAYTLLDYLISDFDRAYPGSTGHLVEGEAAQMAVLRVLAVECPFPNMRDAAVGLVKKVVLSKLDSDETTDSLFLSDTLFASPLGHSLLSAFPSSPSSPSSDALPASTPSMSAEEFVEQYHRGVMERLSFVYVLLKRDTANRTQIASPRTLDTLQSALLDPLSSLFESWSSSSSAVASLDAAIQLEVELVRDLLERVKGAVRDVQR